MVYSPTLQLFRLLALDGLQTLVEHCHQRLKDVIDLKHPERIAEALQLDGAAAVAPGIDVIREDVAHAVLHLLRLVLRLPVGLGHDRHQPVERSRRATGDNPEQDRLLALVRRQEIELGVGEQVGQHEPGRENHLRAGIIQ